MLDSAPRWHPFPSAGLPSHVSSHPLIRVSRAKTELGMPRKKQKVQKDRSAVSGTPAPRRPGRDRTRRGRAGGPMRKRAWRLAPTVFCVEDLHGTLDKARAGAENEKWNPRNRENRCNSGANDFPGPLRSPLGPCARSTSWSLRTHPAISLASPLSPGPRPPERVPLVRRAGSLRFSDLHRGSRSSA